MAKLYDVGRISTLPHFKHLALPCLQASYVCMLHRVYISRCDASFGRRKRCVWTAFAMSFGGLYSPFCKYLKTNGLPSLL